MDNMYNIFGGGGVVVFKFFCSVCVEVLTICLYQKVFTIYLLNFLKISLHLQKVLYFGKLADFLYDLCLQSIVGS